MYECKNYQKVTQFYITYTTKGYHPNQRAPCKSS